MRSTIAEMVGEQVVVELVAATIVEVLNGGLLAWEAAGLPVEREASRT